MALATHQNERRILLLAAAVALVSAAAGFSLWMLSQARPSPVHESLLVLPEPRVLADFDLVDHEGNAFSLENLRGRWSLLFFGFTHCPDICPSTLFDLAQVSQSLAADGNAEDPVQVVLVSVDPERDTPQRLGEYVAWFDPDFVGVTGAPEQLAPLAMRVGVAYRIEEHPPGAANYAVDHSASVFLTDPQGRLHGVFPAPHDAAAMSRDLASFLN